MTDEEWENYGKNNLKMLLSWIDLLVAKIKLKIVETGNNNVRLSAKEIRYIEYKTCSTSELRGLSINIYF